MHFELLNGICDECKKPSKIDLPQSLRRSYIDMYAECPYALHQLLKHNIQSDGNVWSVVGNILHDIFEYNSMLDESMCFDDLYAKYTSELDKYHTSHLHQFDHANKLTKYDVYERMVEKGKNSIENYLKYEETALKPTYVEREIKLTFKDGLPDVTMTLDRITITDSFSEIVDYKSGKVYSGNDIVNGYQVASYILGFRETYGFLPNRFVLLFVDEDKSRVINKVDDNTFVCEIRGKSYVLNLSEKYDSIVSLLTNMTEGKWGLGKNLNSFKCENFCELNRLGYCSGNKEQSFSDYFKR